MTSMFAVCRAGSDGQGREFHARSAGEGILIRIADHEYKTLITNKDQAAERHARPISWILTGLMPRPERIQSNTILY